MQMRTRNEPSNKFIFTQGILISFYFPEENIEELNVLRQLSLLLEGDRHRRLNT